MRNTKHRIAQVKTADFTVTKHKYLRHCLNLFQAVPQSEDKLATPAMINLKQYIFSFADVMKRIQVKE